MLRRLRANRTHLAVFMAAAWLPSIAALSQTSNVQRPTFDVASVRAHDPSDRKNFDNFQTYPDGRFTSENSSLWMLIHYAFQVQPYQIAGGPGWLRSTGFAINAKPAEPHGFADIPLMLQGVLEDRFQLKYHGETRQLPAYDLVVTKLGKLHETVVQGDCAGYLQPSPKGLPKDAACGDLENRPGNARGYKLTATDFAGSLSWLLSKPVVNKTNLAGSYDVELRWTPESVAIRSDATEQNVPDIFTAIQEQLGLKLLPSRAPVQVLVIDHAEMPSDN